MRENTRNTKKKLLAAGVAVALGAGMIGVGANWNSVERIAGNIFTAEVPDPEAMGGAVLQFVDPQKIEHDFDTTIFGHFAEGEWTLRNVGVEAAPFSATFVPVGEISENLAEHLNIRYAAVDENGDVIVPHTFVPGGTLAEPTELTTALGIPGLLPGKSDLSILVQVSLDRPDLLDGDIEDLHTVVADFDVHYINPALS